MEIICIHGDAIWIEEFSPNCIFMDSSSII